MSRSRLVAVIAALAASVTVLSGCAAGDPVPPGPTDAEINTVIDREMVQRWDALGLPATITRPNIARIELAKPTNWSYLQLACYQAAGLDARDVSGDFTVAGYLPGYPAQVVPHGASIAIYTCQAQYPMDPRLVGYLTDAQVLYMYDYFRDRLAPCLELLGYPVPPAPPRGQYIDAVRLGLFWNPYYGDSSHPITESARDLQAIDLRCAPLPEDPYGSFHPIGDPGT